MNQSRDEYRAWLESYVRRFFTRGDPERRTLDEWAVLFWQWMDEEQKREQAEAKEAA